MQNSTKDQIFEASVALFAGKGYSGTSIRDIARSVGIKESSIYNHFAGKRDILHAILSFYIESFQKAVPDREEMEEFASGYTNPADLWVNGILHFMRKLPPLWEKISLILLNEMFLDEQCRSFVLNTMFQTQKEVTEMLLRDLYSRGMIGVCDFRKTAEQYVYMMHGLDIENRLRLLQGKKEDDIKKNMILHMRIFIEGLSTNEKK